MWRLIIADIKNLDVIHCQDYENDYGIFLSIHRVDKFCTLSTRVEYVEYLENIIDYCPICKESMPEHIKIQLKLLL